MKYSRVGQREAVLVIINPDGDLLNVQGALVTLISHPAAVALAAAVWIIPGESKGSWSTSVTRGTLDVPFAIAPLAYANIASRASFIASAHIRR